MNLFPEKNNMKLTKIRYTVNWRACFQGIKKIGLQLKMTIVLMTLVLVIALVTGGTMAWFTDQNSPVSFASFVTGTVNLEITGEKALPDDFRWETEESRQFIWTIENTGSKPAFIRAWPEITVSHNESAWGEGKRFANPGNWAMYFEYPVEGGNSEHPRVVRLLAGQHDEAGTVTIREAGGCLHVELGAAEAWGISEVHLAVADDFSLIPKTPGGPVPGRFPFKCEFDAVTEAYSFVIPMSGTYPDGALKNREYSWTGGETLYIAAHACLVSSETVVNGNVVYWNQTEESPHQWTEYQGRWYYLNGPVLPGGKIKLDLTGFLQKPQETETLGIKLKAEAVQDLPDAVQKIWGLEIPAGFY